jgi:hypothetical protein
MDSSKLESNPSPSSNRCFLYYLPPEILRLLANYFLKDEDQNKKIFWFSRDWRNFLNTNRQHFAKWKKESQLIVLHLPLASKFYSSSEVRERVAQYIENPREQIEIFLTYQHYEHYSTSINLGSINNLKRISISSSHVSSTPSLKVGRVDFVECSLENVSLMDYSNVPHVHYEDTRFSTALDFSVFKELEQGLFIVKSCINYHCLRDLKCLQISHCLSITDVSCFSNIPILTLSHCPNITDVSSLSKCRELDLTGNTGITDVSALGNVYSLKLNRCEDVADVSSLNNVHTLGLSHCPRITDISGLNSVVILDISRSSAISADFTNLQFLKELKMKTHKTKSLQSLRSLRKLELSGNILWKAVLNSSFLVIAKLSELVMKRIDRETAPAPTTMDPEYIQAILHIPNLTLKDCSFFQEFPYIDCLRSLTLSGCENLTSLPCLPALGYLTISSCVRLHTLNILGRADVKYPIYQLKVGLCESLRRISFQRKVFDCSVSGENLNTLEVLEQIDYLKIYEVWMTLNIINKALIVCLMDAHEGHRVYYNEGKDVKITGTQLEIKET